MYHPTKLQSSSVVCVCVACIELDFRSCCFYSVSWESCVDSEEMHMEWNCLFLSLCLFLSVSLSLLVSPYTSGASRCQGNDINTGVGAVSVIKSWPVYYDEFILEKQ